MKNVLLKRLFASTLAGTLALSLPLTAMAASGGEGGTEGDASVVGADGNFFSVVLPTNTASNVNFTVDPQHFLSSGSIEGMNKLDYQTNTQLYFSRINYADLLMGNKTGAGKDKARYYWGNIVNKQGGTKYGNTSNWMTITNKSAKPVTVELKVDWSNTSQVSIVPTRDDALDSDVAAIFMQIEGSEGRTDDFYDYATTYSRTWNYTYDSTAYDVNGVKKPVGGTTVGTTQLVRAYEPTENPHVLKLRSMPAVTDEDTATYVTWVIPTINQFYASLHDVDDIAYRPIDHVVSGAVEPIHQAYYLRAYYLNKANTSDGEATHEVSGIELWNNRNETYQSAYGKTYIKNTDTVEGLVYNKDLAGTTAPFVSGEFTSYDNNINMYPTYGFRLSGEASTAGWGNVTEMPKISLSWKVTIGEPDEDRYIASKNPVVWDGVSDVVTDKTIDLEGVIDDTEYYRVLLDDTTLSSIDVAAGNYTTTVWDSVNGSEKVDTTGFLNAGILDMVRVQDVRGTRLATQGNTHDLRVYINEIMLLNYSQAKFFVDDEIVTLTFKFTDANGEIIPVPVVLKDSKNFVNEVQD